MKNLLALSASFPRHVHRNNARAYATHGTQARIHTHTPNQHSQPEPKQMLPLTQPARPVGASSAAPAAPSHAHSAPPPPPPALSRRQALTGLAILTSAAALTVSRPARADAPAAASVALAAAEDAAVAAAAAPAPAPYASVYFGSGCFWGRQKVRDGEGVRRQFSLLNSSPTRSLAVHSPSSLSLSTPTQDFVDLELALGRTPSQVTSLSGYAGGGTNDQPTCYYYVPPTDRGKIYERQGHAEVVALDLGTKAGDDKAVAEAEFKQAAEIFFTRQFKRVRGRGGKFLMARLDPQDAGPGYRPCVGLPGGVSSPFYPLLEAANVNGMTLKPGVGNVLTKGKASEGDEPGTVWIYDSTALPFHRAEAWHQMHAGLEGSFPRSYLVDQKRASVEAGRAVPVEGCPELPF